MKQVQVSELVKRLTLIELAARQAREMMAVGDYLAGVASKPQIMLARNGHVAGTIGAGMHGIPDCAAQSQNALAAAQIELGNLVTHLGALSEQLGVQVHDHRDAPAD